MILLLELYQAWEPVKESYFVQETDSLPISFDGSNSAPSGSFLLQQWEAFDERDQYLHGWLCKLECVQSHKVSLQDIPC